MFRNCCCLLNVYLPADYRSSAATDQINDTLGELYGFISIVPHDFLIVADLNLSLVDLNFSDDVRFTYISHDGFKSWLDHVAVSTPMAGSAHSILDGRNLSDHYPLHSLWTYRWSRLTVLLLLLNELPVPGSRPLQITLISISL